VQRRRQVRETRVRRVRERAGLHEASREWRVVPKGVAVRHAAAERVPDVHHPLGTHDRDRDSGHNELFRSRRARGVAIASAAWRRGRRRSRPSPRPSPGPHHRQTDPETADEHRDALEGAERTEELRHPEGHREPDDGFGQTRRWPAPRREQRSPQTPRTPRKDEDDREQRQRAGQVDAGRHFGAQHQDVTGQVGLRSTNAGVYEAARA
jgi:hypothetical protein